MKVFISSTSEDLQNHRAVTRNVLLELGWQPVMMEYMGASQKATIAACLESVESCELFILIVAFRQGWVPGSAQGGGGEKSITALELEHARSNDIPVLAFLADESWPGRLWEAHQQAREVVSQFRANLNQPAVFFSHEKDPELPVFRNNLKARLLEHRDALALAIPSQRWAEKSIGSDIFISYASEDRERARTLAAALQRRGWSVWWDRTIPAGRTFSEVIDEALEATRCVVVLWSSNSVTKDWVLEEADDGHERKILVPTFIERVRPPRGFRRIQAADLSAWEGTEDDSDFQLFVNSVESILAASEKAM